MLLLDIGNTRLKWAQAEAGQLGPVHAVAHAGDPVAALQALPPVNAPVWLASVLDANLNAQVLATLKRQYGVGVHQAKAQSECLGLRSGYQQPHRLGVDRWLAMLGLWHQHRAAFCVVSAGTALTFDAVDGDGQHLGGLIAPGIRAMERATLGNTRFETQVLPEPDAPALGADPEHCVAQGALHAALGLIDRAAAGVGGARYLSGGDAPVLAPHLTGDWITCPHSVLDGLLAVAAQAD